MLTKAQLLHALISSIIPVITLFYVKAVDTCQCDTTDWRYTVIKATTFVSAALIVLSIFTAISNQHIVPPAWIMMLISVLALINVYALFTYTHDIAKSCPCMDIEHKKLNTFMQWWSWIPVIILGLSIVLPLFVVSRKH